MTLTERIDPYAYYIINTTYQIIDQNGEQNKQAGRGGHAEKDGSILISSVKEMEYKERYKNPTAKINIVVYSKPVVVNDTKASFDITVHSVSCNERADK